MCGLGSSLGVDLGEIDPDRPISDYEFNSAMGFLKSYAAAQPDKTLTFRDIAKRQMSGQWLVGTPEQIADKLENYAARGVDGFNLLYATTPGTFVDFIDGVAPILQQRGLMQTGYQPGSFREKIFGHARLPDRHPGASFRRHS